jgi:tRNA 2-thiouridine synthesizing protein A
MTAIEIAPRTEVRIDARVDARGQSCPMPIVRTAQAARAMLPGTTIEVLATDPGSVRDFTAWCRVTGHELLEQSAEGATYRFVIRRK